MVVVCFIPVIRGTAIKYTQTDAFTVTLTLKTHLSVIPTTPDVNFPLL